MKSERLNLRPSWDQIFSADQKIRGHFEKRSQKIEKWPVAERWKCGCIGTFDSESKLKQS